MPGDRLHYQYDYGDNWWLTIELEDVETGHVPPDRADVSTAPAPVRRRTAVARMPTS